MTPLYDVSDTIAAIATPPGSGGIGIIRISGAASRNILSALFRRSKGNTKRLQKRSSLALQSHRLYLGHIIDPAAKVLVDEVLDTVRKLKDEGMTILLVEQNVREALDLADRGYILQTGRIVGEGTGVELMASDQVKSAFLGL